jgi:hypothetical protein
MNKNSIRTAGWPAGKRGTLLLLTLALALPITSWAGGIRGVLKTDQGRPIGKAKVCLLTEASAADGWKCIKTRPSAKNGKYVFSNLRKGSYYVAVGKIDTMGPSYAWLPAVQKVEIKKQTSIVKAVDFGWINQANSAGFKYNNFRNDRPLVAADFPELAEFDTAQDAVALKIYLPDPESGTGEQVLFLGKVENRDALAINLSIPTTVNTLVYEIFSPNHTVSGTLNLQ